MCLTGYCTHRQHQNCNYTAWRWGKLQEAIETFRWLLQLPIRRIAVENPIMHGWAKRKIGAPTSIVHPYQFGDPWTKRTGWWLRGLYPLQGTNLVIPQGPLVAFNGGGTVTGLSVKGSADRSRTPEGMAQAIADQWGMRTRTRQTLF